MSADKEFTFAEIASRNNKKDLWMVIHDKVYDSTAFVDEHPGGEEVLLDVGGVDATEAFEDVGHSDEARELLDTLFVGNLKRVEGDPVPKVQAPTTTASGSTASTGMGIGMYVVILLGGAAAYGAYQYIQTQQPKA